MSAVDDCFVHDRDRMRHADALDVIDRSVSARTGSVEIALSDALGRTLATDVFAPRPIPASDNAAVDGYAYRAADRREAPMVVSSRAAAGDAPAKLDVGTAMRIFTGAPMPKGADTVAMQEDCKVEAGAVALPDLREGANRRRAGEDVAADETIARAGTILRAQEVAAIAATGLDLISVRERVRVALLSNGDELLRPGEPFRPGAVYDSNRPMLLALLRFWGCDVVDLGLLPDDPDRIRTAIGNAAGDYDAVVATGGASKGEEDHVLSTLDALGERLVWQLAVKPGRPMMMGRIGESAFVGLPGNPVAALVCALLYLRPILARLGGSDPSTPRRFHVPAAFSLRSKPDRREFLRGRLVGEGAAVRVEKFARDGSGLVSGLRWAEGLIEIDEATTSVSDGEPVAFVPFSEFGTLA